MKILFLPIFAFSTTSKTPLTEVVLIGPANQIAGMMMQRHDNQGSEGVAPFNVACSRKSKAESFNCSISPEIRVPKAKQNTGDPMQLNGGPRPESNPVVNGEKANELAQLLDVKLDSKSDKAVGPVTIRCIKKEKEISNTCTVTKRDSKK